LAFKIIDELLKFTKLFENECTPFDMLVPPVEIPGVGLDLVEL